MTFTALNNGPGDGPLLLLLHGLSRTSWEWHDQIPELAHLGYRTIAPARVARLTFGPSPKALQFNFGSSGLFDSTAQT